MLANLKDRVVSATTSLFSHGPRPLEKTLAYRGEPGLLGPDSVSWRVIGDVTAFVGGIRALLVQGTHPEVVAGVAQHSRYQSDPLGRLNRTSFYVTATTYGALPEVDAAVAMVRHAHRPVQGSSGRGLAYDANDPALAAWVHNALTESFLASFQAFAAEPLSAQDADRFVREQASIGALLGADPLPDSADALAAWVRDHPALAPSREQGEVLAFLRRPPLPVGVSFGYRLLFEAAVSTLPERLRDIMDLPLRPRGARIGTVTTRSLRWALGHSPSWHLALVRAEAPIPPGLFRQALRGVSNA